MQKVFANPLWLGIIITALTTATAFSGAPKGFEDFAIPIWELLLQLNLCTGLAFVIMGVLDLVEAPRPKLGPASELFSAGFLAYVVVCLAAAVGIPFALQLQLFLFVLAATFLAVGWAQFGFRLLRQLDQLEL